MSERKKILAINDLSCAGRISLSVIIPILSAMNIEVYPLPTAILSTHTAYPDAYCKTLSDEMVNIISHWESLNLYFNAIYCGFLGEERQIKIVQEILRKFNSENTFFLLDPCMADNGKLYKTYNQSMVGGVKTLCEEADLIVPNLTEAYFLANQIPLKQQITDITEINDLFNKLLDLHPKNMLITGVEYNNSLVTFLKQENSNILPISSEIFIKQKFFGAGDIFASVVIGGILNNLSIYTATQLAISFLNRVINKSLKASDNMFASLKFESELDYLITQLHSLKQQKTH